ncbi:MAG: globin [Pseudomonadota bacterium]|nr:globin [Pseudomonadota bacterium]
MAQADVIHDTLAQVVDRVGDPKELIYSRLFKIHPEFEELFVLDTDGGVRGPMLESCYNCITGAAERSQLPRFHLEAARMIHDGYGIDESQIDAMFEAIRDTFRDVLAENWTPAMETEWSAILVDLADMGRSPAPAT